MIAYLSLFSIPLEQWLGVFISYVIYNVLRFVFLFLFGTCVVKRGPVTDCVTLLHPNKH